MVLEFDEEALATEDALEATGEFQRLGVVVVQQCLQDDTAEAARGRDDSVVEAVEQVPVEARLVVVTLEERE